MPRLQRLGFKAGQQLEEALVPALVLLLALCFARGLPWILAQIAEATVRG